MRAKTAWIVGPLLLAAAWCLLMRSEPRSMIAPLLGPWAGHLYGHGDCTAAESMAVLSWAVTALGLVSALLLIASSGWTRPWLALLPATGWSVLWSALALLSVANTLS